MKFVIQGKQYDVVKGLENATLQTLYVLKVKQGIGMKSLMQQANKMAQIKDPIDLLEDAETFQVLMAVIWLARKGAGENISFEEANEFGIGELEVLNEDDDEKPTGEGETGPKADSAQEKSADPAPATT